MFLVLFPDILWCSYWSIILLSIEKLNFEVCKKGKRHVCKISSTALDTKIIAYVASCALLWFAGAAYVSRTVPRGERTLSEVAHLFESVPTLPPAAPPYCRPPFHLPKKVCFLLVCAHCRRGARTRKSLNLPVKRRLSTINYLSMTRAKGQQVNIHRNSAIASISPTFFSLPFSLLFYHKKTQTVHQTLTV